MYKYIRTLVPCFWTVSHSTRLPYCTDHRHHNFQNLHPCGFCLVRSTFLQSVLSDVSLNSYACWLSVKKKKIKISRLTNYIYKHTLLTRDQIMIDENITVERQWDTIFRCVRLCLFFSLLSIRFSIKSFWEK